MSTWQNGTQQTLTHPKSEIGKLKNLGLAPNEVYQWPVDASKPD